MPENVEKTTFANIVKILSELWIDFKHDEEFKDFVDYNDLGLPLAYAIDRDLVNTTPKATAFIMETWDLFMTALEIEDSGFESLDDVLMLGE